MVDKVRSSLTGLVNKSNNHIKREIVAATPPSRVHHSKTLFTFMIILILHWFYIIFTSFHLILTESRRDACHAVLMRFEDFALYDRD